MATGIIRDSLVNVRTRKDTHGAAVSAGDIVVINGQVLVAVNAALINAENVYAYRGKVEAPKKAALALGSGSVVYWDAGNGVVTDVPDGNTKIGITLEPAAAADTTILVMLAENK